VSAHYECSQCGLCAIDLPDGVDPEYVFTVVRGVRAVTKLGDDGHVTVHDVLTHVATTRAQRDAARRMLARLGAEDCAPMLGLDLDEHDGEDEG
jgi:hypothetical protein